MNSYIRVDIGLKIELAGIISGLIDLFEPIVGALENHDNGGLRFGSHDGEFEGGGRGVKVIFW